MHECHFLLSLLNKLDSSKYNDCECNICLVNVVTVQAIFTAGYKAVLHIHSVVEECEIVELLQQIDPKTKKPMKKKVLFVKNGAVVMCRVQVQTLTFF